MGRHKKVMIQLAFKKLISLGGQSVKDRTRTKKKFAACSYTIILEQVVLDIRAKYRLSSSHVQTLEIRQPPFYMVEKRLVWTVVAACCKFTSLSDSQTTDIFYNAQWGS
jgi:hypothetical protein